MSTAGQLGKYQPYPEYKDSGVEWLGEIPTHWVVSRIKNSALINPPKSEVRSLPPETEVSFLPMESIGEKGELDASRTKLISDVLTGYTYVADGDVMLAKITPCFENGKAAIANGLLNGVAFATTEVIPLRCNDKSETSFMYYLVTSDPFKSIAEGSMYGAGGQKRVADSFVAEYHFARPSQQERIQIAAFLDYETARIDKLIAKQQQLIELLKEKRQAVISHAVTKGLNPNAPMKDSGVEWLGEVPEHWGVCLIKHKCINITDGAHISPVTNGGEKKFVSIKDIEDGVINFDSAILTSLESYKHLVKSGCKPEPGDILFSKDGTIGQTAISPTDADYVIASSLILIRPNIDVVTSVHLDFLLQSCAIKEQVEGFVKGAALRRLSIQNTLKIFGVFPPLEEQGLISNYISSELLKLKTLENNALRVINLLQERRAVLISAAVTGKIDLRGWKPPQNEVAA